MPNNKEQRFETLLRLSACQHIQQLADGVWGGLTSDGQIAVLSYHPDYKDTPEAERWLRRVDIDTQRANPGM